MARLLDHVSLFVLIFAILTAIFVLDQRSGQLRRNFGCIPQGLGDIQPGQTPALCADFFVLDSTVEYLFLIVASSIVVVIVTNTIKSAGQKNAKTFHDFNIIYLIRLVYKIVNRVVALTIRIFREQASKRASSAVPYIIILLFGIAFWTPGIFSPNFFIWNDASVYLNFSRELDVNYYAWYDNNLGRPYAVSSQLPLITFYYVINSTGLPLVSINHLFMLLSVTVAGWTMYYLLSRMLKAERSRISAFAGAILYMLSPVVAAYGLGTTLALSYSLFPLFFYFMYAGMLQKGNELRNASATGLVLLGIAGAVQFIGLAFVMTVLLVIGILVFRRQINVKFLLMMFVIGFTINLFWLGPLLFGEDDILGAYTPEKTGHPLLTESENADILLSLRLLPSSFFNSLDLGWTGIIMWFVPAYCFSAAFLMRRKLVYFFAGLAILSILFSTGIKYSVLAEIFQAVTGIVPQLFIPLQNLDDYLFLASFSFAILFSFTTRSLIKRILHMKITWLIQYRTIISITAFFLIALLISANSFFSLIGDTNITLNHSPGANIPSSYFNIQDIVSADDLSSGYRMLVLPWQQWYIEYTWADSDMVDIVNRLSPLPTVGYAISGANDAVFDLRSVMLNPKLSNIADLKKAFSDMNIKYILIHKDFRNTTSLTGFLDDGVDRDPKVYSYSFNNKLAEGLGGKVVVDNENYTLYEISDIDKAVEVFPYVDDPTLSSEFKKVNPTLYAGMIKSKEPVSIILGQQYDDRWRILVDGKELDKSRVATSILANFTAWEREGTGNAIVSASLGEKEVRISGSTRLTTKIGENYYYMNGRFDHPIDLSSYDAISLAVKMNNTADKVVKYATLHDSDGKRKEILWPKINSKELTRIDIPLGKDISRNNFDMNNVTGISINFVNNELDLYNLAVEIYDIQLVRNSHFIYGGYANGWRIDEPGEHKVEIQYEPQAASLFYAIVSVISFLFAVVVMCMNHARKINFKLAKLIRNDYFFTKM